MSSNSSRSSDVPLARLYLRIALDEYKMDIGARQYLLAALSLMTRASAVRRAPATLQRITPEMRRAVLNLQHTDLTIHEIANAVGLANSGRVSEIMTGKR
jgi:AraC-like DNA-binding protein